MHDESLGSQGGLIYNRARELHPRLGRFMQRDPLGYVDGMSLYQYLNSHPVMATDSLGLREKVVGRTSRSRLLISDLVAETTIIWIRRAIGYDDECDCDRLAYDYWEENWFAFANLYATETHVEINVFGPPELQLVNDDNEFRVRKHVYTYSNLEGEISVEKDRIFPIDGWETYNCMNDEEYTQFLMDRALLIQEFNRQVDDARKRLEAAKSWVEGYRGSKPLSGPDTPLRPPPPPKPPLRT